MKSNTYLVSRKGNRTLIFKQTNGEGDLEEVKNLNFSIGNNDMRRLQEAFDQAAIDELEKQQKDK